MSNSFRHKTSDERIAYTFSQAPSSPVSELSPHGRRHRAISKYGRLTERLVPGSPLPPSTRSSVRKPSPLSRSISFSSDADISGDVGLGSSLRHEYSVGSVTRVSSRASLYQGGSTDGMTTLNIAERYRITPEEEGILLYPHQHEDDDELHQPDDEKEARSWNIFTRRGLVQVGSLMFIVFGLLTLFIGYPIM